MKYQAHFSLIIFCTLLLGQLSLNAQSYEELIKRSWDELGIHFDTSLVTHPSLNKEYVKAQIHFKNHDDYIQLCKEGICLDHFEHQSHSVIGEFIKDEIDAIRNNFCIEILDDDVIETYKNQNNDCDQTPIYKTSESNEWINAGCKRLSMREHPQLFQLGNMGGYFRYEEIFAHLDAMAIKFPDLITSRFKISEKVTHQGNSIYGVKVSKNVNVDEEEPEVLYFSLIHAREPGSVSSMIYYIYYLLENYQKDELVTYLLDHTELFFVPCLNPDGYLLNQQQNPDGGGMWRKNLRENDDGSFGVDLNRNFAVGFAHDDIGSSGFPSKATYRGEAPFSEPESQILKEFIEDHQFSLSFNTHSYSNVILQPYGYSTSVTMPDEDLYSKYRRYLTENNFYAFGTPIQALWYVSNGRADDWLYGEQNEKNKIISFTLEIGEPEFGFWAPKSEIIKDCNENLDINLKLALLATNYSLVRSNASNVIDELQYMASYNVQVLGLNNLSEYSIEIIPISANILSVGSKKIYSAQSANHSFMDSILITIDPNIHEGDLITYQLVYNNGIYSEYDTVNCYYGESKNLFFDHCNSIEKWKVNGNFNPWETTEEEYYSFPSCFTDSKFGNYTNNNYNSLQLKSTVDLVDAFAAELSFRLKCDIERAKDFLQILISEDAGVNWTALCGQYSKPGTNHQLLNQPIYDDVTDTWIKERISLHQYIGKQILIKFEFRSNETNVRDGVYIDDICIDVVTSFSTSQPTINQYNEFYVYQNIPNPSIGSTLISYSRNDKMNTDIYLYLVNALGQIVDKLKVGQKFIILNTNKYQNGVYYYYLTDGRVKSNSQRLSILH